MRDFLKSIAVLIPSLDPDEQMPQYVSGLHHAGFRTIIVVDDGSRESTQKYFDAVREIDGVVLLRHAVNQGKGRALKTGFHHFLNTYDQDAMLGIVTADADGQHTVEDTVKVASELYRGGVFVLGTRDFNDPKVPFKSRNGNKITTIVFYALYGRKLQDTQTGLRGIPYAFISDCLAFDGERFDYEIAMLIETVRAQMPIIEEPIQTIYIDSNRATHFQAVRDSIKIYKVILKMFFQFAISGIASFAIDISLFALLTKIFLNSLEASASVFVGTTCARAVSSYFNYTVNRKIFIKKYHAKGILFKYYTLCIAQMLCSWLLVAAVFRWIQWDTTFIKCFIDLILFFISYHIQRLWVFKEDM